MHTRESLRIAILRSGRRQYELAQAAGISETRLSRIANDRADPSPEEMVMLADVLQVDVEKLFGDAQGGRR